MSNRREWAALYMGMLLHNRYRRTPQKVRGALLHVLLLAGTTEPEATWPEAELRDTFGLDGLDPEDVDELVRLGWLDRDGATLTVHNWDQHQVAASLEIKRAFEANRLRQWRRDRKAINPPRTPPVENSTEQYSTGVRTPYDAVRTPNGRDVSPKACGTCGQPFDNGEEPHVVFLDGRFERHHKACLRPVVAT